jgi:hypothetical protein
LEGDKAMSMTTAVPVFSTPVGPLRSAATQPAITAARVVLERGKHSWIWVVPACPYCGKQHDHYGGSLDDDPFRYAGCMLVARCDNAERKRFAPYISMGDLRYVLEPDAGDTQRTTDEQSYAIATC